MGRIQDEEQLNFDKVERRINTVAGGSTGTIRNLRIREDTAKYLINLDQDSAYYDPKSRSMREDPNPTGDRKMRKYVGDNIIRTSGKAFRDFIELHSQQPCAPVEMSKTISSISPSQSAAIFYTNKIKKEK